MVLALAGDSTITRFRDIPVGVPGDYAQKSKTADDAAVELHACRRCVKKKRICLLQLFLRLMLSERLFRSRQRPGLPSEHKPVPGLAG